MRKCFGIALLLTGAAGSALASVVAPEIGGSSAVGAVALLSGGLLVLRSRRK